MTALVVVWSDEAERDLLALPSTEAESVLGAVEEFAVSGRGFLRVLLDGSGERRLYVAGHCVHLALGGSTLYAIRVFRR